MSIRLTDCSAVFQAGGLVVLLAEITRKAYLGSVVPVIVNAILNEHQIIVDIVAFVNKGDFPRSRLGEKQRGKILAGWVTRKMRTLAQFAIRDMDPNSIVGGDPGADDPNPHRASVSSQRSMTMGGLAPGSSSLRNVEHAPQILEQEEFEHQVGQMAALPPQAQDGIAEMPGDEGPAFAQQANAPQGHGYVLPDFDSFGREDGGPPPVGAKPGQTPPTIHLPGVDGRESMDLWKNQQGGGGGQSEEDWTAQALMHMNLANDLERKQGQQH